MPIDLQAALDGSACLGAWAYEVAADRFTLPPALGDLLGIDARDGAEGIALARAFAGVQTEDRLRIENLIHVVRETGGSFEAELRARPRHRDPYWLRLMGRCDRDPTTGTVLARGLAFDLTERRMTHGPVAGRAHRQANQLADHVIAMQGLVAELRNPPLAQLVDKMAKEIGYELARRLHAAEPGPRH